MTAPKLVQLVKDIRDAQEIVVGLEVERDAIRRASTACNDRLEAAYESHRAAQNAVLDYANRTGQESDDD